MTTAKSERSLTQVVITNTAFNILGKSWGIIIALFLTPYTISCIGVERYGVWALVSVVTSYFGLLDLGIGSSYVKYIAEYHTKRDCLQINRIVNSGLAFYGVFMAVVLALAYFFMPQILAILKIPPALSQEVTFVFWVGIFTFCVSNAASSFVAVQSGLQRMDIYNKVSLAVSIPYALGTVLALEMGYGLRGLIVVSAITMVLAGAANAIAAFRLLPELELSPKYYSWHTFKTLFSYGSKLQIARVSSTVSMQIDKILLTYYLTLGMVTMFQLASAIIEQAKAIPLLFLGALIPAFAELDARQEHGKITDNYIRGTKYVTLLSFPLFSMLIVSAGPLLLAWMGKGYGQAAILVRILAVGWALAVISGVRSAVLQAINRPGIEMRAGLIAAVFNIPLSIILIKTFGFSGAALGTTIALAASGWYGFERLNRELKVDRTFYTRAWLPQLTGICLAAGAAAFGVGLLLGGVTPENRFGGLAVLATQCVVFCAIYIALLAKAKPLDEWDCQRIMQCLPKIMAGLVGRFCRS